MVNRQKVIAVGIVGIAFFGVVLFVGASEPFGFDADRTQGDPNGSVEPRTDQPNNGTPSDDKTPAEEGTSANDGTPSGETTEEERAPEKVELAPDDIQFQEVATDRGFDYSADFDESEAFGSGREGVFVADVNRDGWPDILAIGGSDPGLFINQEGRFAESDALPTVNVSVRNALFFDHDNDGWEDLLLLPRDGKPIFFENRNGEFSRNDVGFDVELTIGMSASAGDYDNDGCLDVFIAQNGDWRKGIPAQGLEENTTQPDGYYEEDDGNPNFLFDGDCGSFERVTDAGIEGNHWSLVTRFVDVTGNSYPDIYVANDYNADVLYLNHGNESFKRTIVPETNRHGMSIEVGDVTGNGLPDIFVTSIYHNGSTIAQQRVPSLDTTGNNLLINQGNGTFESEEDRYGVRKGGWGWAAVLEDLNNSGTLELLHATRDFIPVTEVGNSYVWNGTTRTGPSLWTRTGDEQFERIDSAERGFIPSNSKGIASFDFNRDGKQDLVVANSNSTERFWLYENTHEANRSWIQVDVLGTETQTSIGAIVEISNGTDTWREFATDQSDFQAQDSRMLHVGLGDALVVNVTVTWPDGTERTFEDVAVNQRITVHPGNGLDGERDSERE